MITGCDKSQKPAEIGGGILADEMGLGKTLTMLSAMIRTSEEAKAFAGNSYQSLHLGTGQSLVPSRATLVVVPSPCKFEILQRSTNRLTKCSAPQRMDARDQIVRHT